jgi:predicted Zn-dependent protease
MTAGFRALAFGCALLAGCATVTNPVTGERELSVMSEQDEIAAGRQAHQEVMKEYPAYDNPALQAYVNELGQRLAKQSHRKNLDWRFTVLDTHEINAFALPGGYIYVTRGILAHLDSEADLAGVIGHEIGHVTARHAAQRATRAQTAGIGVLAATILGAVLEARGARGATDLAGAASQGLAAGYIASYSRDQELQADSLGAEYLARSRYDPKNMIDVIGALKDQERYAADTARAEGRRPPAGTHWLSSHPSNEQRLQDIRRIAAQYKGSYGDDGRARYLKAIEGLTFGESREQGVTRGRHFYHEPLGIALTAPEGWRMQNTREALLIVNREEVAGLVVSALPPKAGGTHEEIIRNVFNPLQGRTERLSLGGFAATHFAGTARNRQGQAQAVEATVLTGPGNRHYLLGYAARDAQALARARGGLRAAEASFRALSQAERAAARPWHLRSAPFPAGGFAELAARSPLPNAERQLRLLNGVYSGGGAPAAGQAVKIVE